MRVWRALPMTSSGFTAYLLGWQLLLALAAVAGISILDIVLGRTFGATSYGFLILVALASISTATAMCPFTGGISWRLFAPCW